MSEIEYKIVCIGELAIPVDEKWNWLAMNSDGVWCLHSKEPWRGARAWYSSNPFPLKIFVPYAPEPGPWDDQLYWIG